MSTAQGEGIETRGCDVSLSMLALAADRGLDVVGCSAKDMDLSHATAVTALGEVLCYAHGSEGAQDGGHDGGQWRAVMAKAARALPLGGLFICDLLGLETPVRSASHDVGGGRTLSVNSHLDGRDMCREITVAQDGAVVSSERHVQTLIDPAEVLAEGTRLGFDLRLSDTLAGCRLLPGRFGVWAVRI